MHFKYVEDISNHLDNFFKDLEFNKIETKEYSFGGHSNICYFISYKDISNRYINVLLMITDKYVKLKTTIPQGSPLQPPFDMYLSIDNTYYLYEFFGMDNYSSYDSTPLSNIFSIIDYDLVDNYIELIPFKVGYHSENKE